MNKVAWPTYPELRGSTYLIIIFSFMFVVFLFGVDWLVQKLVSVLL
jgi:preprotein translocase subunit SecE